MKNIVSVGKWLQKHSDMLFLKIDLKTQSIFEHLYNSYTLLFYGKILANCVDPEGMPNFATFHNRGLHCLQKY